LIRARNPHTEEIIPPRQLLYACEKINLQHQFDQAARIQALRDAAALPRTGARFFINFHPCSLYDPAISLQTTLDVARESQIAASQLVFEVVETERIVDRARLSSILWQYRQRGVGIALDDMGSSSDTLSYIAELMPDYVKIDSELVYEAARRASARHALQATVELAKRLNMKVIAKGIETRAQMQACQQAGVDFMQGFLFAHPANPPQSVSPGLFSPYAAHKAA
jgi:EAL domain-containing protein (putative c-di-GMP-specific phosphodiesterase class I)